MITPCTNLNKIIKTTNTCCIDTLSKQKLGLDAIINYLVVSNQSIHHASHICTYTYNMCVQSFRSTGLNLGQYIAYIMFISCSRIGSLGYSSTIAVGCLLYFSRVRWDAVRDVCGWLLQEEQLFNKLVN